MKSKALRAHFDGSQIRLDEPFELSPDDELLITVLPTGSTGEREVWSRFALESLALAYDDDEPEFPRNLIQEANPEYEGR